MVWHDDVFGYYGWALIIMIQKITKASSYFSFILLLVLFASIDINYCVKVDFSSFYSSLISFHQGMSPYNTNHLTFLDPNKTASVNLNTPFFVILLLPLGYVSYPTAFILWSFPSEHCLTDITVCLKGIFLRRKTLSEHFAD